MTWQATMPVSRVGQDPSPIWRNADFGLVQVGEIRERTRPILSYPTGLHSRPVRFPIRRPISARCTRGKAVLEFSGSVDTLMPTHRRSMHDATIATST